MAITVVDASGMQTVQATVQGDGTWSASLATPLAEGQYTITAEVSDNAGNQANDQVQGEVDITAPSVTISPVGSVNDETPVISGSAEGNEGDVVSITVVDASGDSQVLRHVPVMAVGQLRCPRLLRGILILPPALLMLRETRAPTMNLVLLILLARGSRLIP